MRREIVEQYPTVKDIEVIYKDEIGRIDSQEFLRDDKKLFIHSGDAGKVANVGKHLLYDLDSVLLLKKELEGRSNSEKSTAFVVESKDSIDGLEGDLRALKEDGEIINEDSSLRITDTQRDEHSIDIQVSYTHRRSSQRNLMDATSRTTYFKIHETEEDNIYKVTQNFFNADEFDSVKELFGYWDRKRQFEGKSEVERADIRIEAISPLEDRVDFFDEFLTYNPNNWDTRNVRHLGVRQNGDQDDSFDSIESAGDELEEQIDKHLSNITELALTGKSLRDNPIVDKCIENDFFFDSAKIYCENVERARGVEISVKFKQKGRNAFDLSINKEYELVDGDRKREPFSPNFRDQTRREFRDAVVDLYGEFKDMPDLVKERGDSFDFTDLPGIGPTIAENLESEYESVYELMDAEVDNLIEIDGIGESTAERILATEV
ncbi:helix-hairpin-helix domain-containing protein [Natronorubrum daqingense]|uniref:Helix-hairpin-helix domain-containing protein n=1 Tax=Natronorubrum daqingense TaxID=588898 RepID=A0A1N7FFF7_9EURY|nr:helix-hairpin-helix domain-containing protein [Natronorubrum daqingense]APX98397.1 hypothetical protein BB347_16955 [Natronorubrum daqingense]SIR99052.1 Helix-hairpin-helix domain-containing protein [Natronorubrum daqingense]